MFSDRSALDILNEHKTELDKENDYHIPVMATTKFSTGIKLVIHVLYILFHCWDFYGLKLYQEKTLHVQLVQIDKNCIQRLGIVILRIHLFN